MKAFGTPLTACASLTVVCALTIWSCVKIDEWYLSDVKPGSVWQVPVKIPNDPFASIPAPYKMEVVISVKDRYVQFSDVDGAWPESMPVMMFKLCRNKIKDAPEGTRSKTFEITIKP